VNFAFRQQYEGPNLDYSPLTRLRGQTRMPCEIAFCRESLPPLAELEREWRALEGVSRPSFFLSWAWIGSLLTAIPETARPMLLRGRVQGETAALALVGRAITRRRHGLIRSRGLYLNETGDPQYDAMTVEHNGILSAAGDESAVIDALLSWFAGLRGEADELFLSGSLLRLPEAALAKYRLTRGEIVKPSYSVDLSCLAANDGALDPVLSANARQQLRRAIRHFEAQGPLRFREAATEGEAQSWFTGLKALHCASWERRGIAHSFRSEIFEKFHRRLIERNFPDGLVQLGEARSGERVIGYLYNFRRDGHVYAYQSGFADADPRERPGVVTHALAIQHASRSGMRIYDFMAGRNRLKESFSTCCEPMLWQVVQQPRLAFRFEHLARRLNERVRGSTQKSLAGDTAKRYGRRRSSPGVPCRPF
jgi:CelD/BcsL family acetyltransferase involved in cellulose biosynthesis